MWPSFAPYRGDRNFRTAVAPRKVYRRMRARILSPCILRLAPLRYFASMRERERERERESLIGAGGGLISSEVDVVGRQRGDSFKREVGRFYMAIRFMGRRRGRSFFGMILLEIERVIICVLLTARDDVVPTERSLNSMWVFYGVRGCESEFTGFFIRSIESQSRLLIEAVQQT